MNEKQRVLIVDDDEIILKVLKFFLNQHNIEVEGFQNPLECLNLLKEKGNIPKVIVVDFNMLEMTGAHFIHECHILDPSVQYVLTSGLSLDSCKPKLKEIEGINYHFLPKPFTMQRLLEIIQLIYSTLPEENE